MKRRTDQPSPMFAEAKTTFLPKCEATSDEIVRSVVEGFTANRRCAKPVERREEAA